jgi:hypothetical protein
MAVVYFNYKGYHTSYIIVKDRTAAVDWLNGKQPWKQITDLVEVSELAGLDSDMPDVYCIVYF